MPAPSLSPDRGPPWTRAVLPDWTPRGALLSALSPQPAALPPTPGYQERGRGQEQPAGPEVEARLEAQHHVDIPAEPLDACTGEGGEWSHPQPHRRQQPLLHSSCPHRKPWPSGPGTQCRGAPG